MAEYIFEGDYSNNKKSVNFSLFLIRFIDENNTHIIYSPHLDLSGYGNNEVDAKRSFEIALEDFIDYTLKKKTLSKILLKLGWSVKGSVKNPKKVIAPSITSVIKENKYVSDIFDNYPVNTYHEKVGLPAFA